MLLAEHDSSVPSVPHARAIVESHGLSFVRELSNHGVYLVTNTENKKFAAKICLLGKVPASATKIPLATRLGQMENEVTLLTGPLRGCAGVPSVSVRRTSEHVMTLVAPVGRTLSVSSASLSDGELLRVGQRLVGVLQEVHNRGVVHRDVKPENIVMDEEGNLTLIDFGYSVLTTERFSLQNLRVVVGTEAYGSDNFHLKLPLGPQDDFQSLGFTLHALRVGVPQWMQTVARKKKPSFARMCAADPVTQQLLSQYVDRSRTNIAGAAGVMLTAVVGWMFWTQWLCSRANGRVCALCHFPRSQTRSFHSMHTQEAQVSRKQLAPSVTLGWLWLAARQSLRHLCSALLLLAMGHPCSQYLGDSQ